MFCAAILVHITRYLHREDEPLEILGIRPALDDGARSFFQCIGTSIGSVVAFLCIMQTTRDEIYCTVDYTETVDTDTVHANTQHSNDTTQQHDTRKHREQHRRVRDDIRLMMKIGGYGQHLQKENVLEEPGLVTGR